MGSITKRIAKGRNRTMYEVRCEVWVEGSDEISERMPNPRSSEDVHIVHVPCNDPVARVKYVESALYELIKRKYYSQKKLTGYTIIE